MNSTKSESLARSSNAISTAVSQISRSSSVNRPSLMTAAAQMKASKVRLFRNGDPFYKGIVVAITMERFRTFDSLLAELNKTTLCDPSVLHKGVRYIFTLDGEQIRSLDQLRDGDAYVCASVPAFRRMDYTKITKPINWSMNFKSGDESKTGVARSFGDFSDLDWNTIEPKMIYTIRAGPRPRNVARSLLNKRTARSFDQVMTALAESVNMETGAIRQLYTITGKQVLSLKDFLQEDSVFIAFGSEKFSSSELKLNEIESKFVNGSSQRASRSSTTKAAAYLKRSKSKSPDRPLSKALANASSHGSPVSIDKGTSEHWQSLSPADPASLKADQPRTLAPQRTETRSQLEKPIPSFSNPDQRDLSPPSSPRMGSGAQSSPRADSNPQSSPRMGSNPQSSPRMGSNPQSSPRMGSNPQSSPRIADMQPEIAISLPLYAPPPTIDPEECKLAHSLQKKLQQAAATIATTNDITNTVTTSPDNEGCLENVSGLADDQHVPAALLNRFIVGKTVARSGYASLRTGVDRKNENSVAVKIYNKAEMNKEKECFAYSELTLMKRLKHQNVIHLLDELDTPNELFIVLELPQGGDLFESIIVSSDYSEACASRLFFQLCFAINFLHSMNIVHRNIRPESILVFPEQNGQKHLKLTDFTMATEILAPLSAACGTLNYMAPEMLAEKRYSTKVDVWAAGVVGYVMLCGFLPYTGSSKAELLKRIRSGPLDFPSPAWDGISDSAKDLIAFMMEEDVNIRSTATDVLDHPWLSDNEQRSSNLQPTVGSNIMKMVGSLDKYKRTFAALIGAHHLDMQNNQQQLEVYLDASIDAMDAIQP